MKTSFTKMILMALLVISGTAIKAQDHKVKVGEFDYSQYQKIEDRVFFLNEMQENGFLIEAGDTEGTVDIYAVVQENRTANDEDIDNYFAAMEQIKENWQSFSVLERKSERVAYYVMNYHNLKDEVFSKIDQDFNKVIRDTENSTCETALPFCSDNGEYHFYPGVNSGSACGSGTTNYCSEPINCDYTSNSHHSYYGISTAPNPAFYFMRIGQPGNIDIYMEGCTTPGGTPNIDIDFVCWGPFATADDICNISCSNMVDASYSAAATEHCYIDNAQTGQFYLLLITNYGNQSGEFSFSNQGGGSTDCGIMEPHLESNSPLCYGDELILQAIDYSGADSYFWEGPGGWTSTQQNPTRPNATNEMSGTYSCTITKNDESAVSEIEISVLERPVANFVAPSHFCIGNGNAINFVNISSTLPEGGTSNVYTWDFGDGQTSSEFSPSHLYTETGTYTVTLTASAGGGSCIDEKTMTIEVGDAYGKDEYVTSCYSFVWYDQAYPVSGDYIHTIPSGSPEICDTIITLHLTVTNYIQHEFDAESCESYQWNDIVYASSGDFFQAFTSTYGCDSIVIMHLTVKDKSESEFYVEECPPYSWDEQDYYFTGDYSRTYEAANGCDSVSTMHFTAKEAPYNEETVIACGSYTWEDVEYTHTGIYHNVYPVDEECDSVAVLRLTIKKAPQAYITGDLWVAEGLQETTVLTAWGGTSFLWSTGDTTQSITVTTAMGSEYSVIVTNEDGCVSTAEAVVINATGVEESSINLNIYPNPTNNILYIEADEINKVRISDIVGQVLFEKNTHDNNVQIDMSNYATGQYFIQVHVSNGVATRKIIKM